MDVLKEAAERSIAYLEGLEHRRVAPEPAAVAGLSALDIPLPEASLPATEVLAELDRVGSPATVATAGPRFFGFVIGGSLPAALGANWLAGAWDQNAGLWAASPVAAQLEIVALRWLRTIAGVDETWGGSFVTGATMANFTALAAGRHAVLAHDGWDVERQGLYGAPGSPCSWARRRIRR